MRPRRAMTWAAALALGVASLGCVGGEAAPADAGPDPGSSCMDEPAAEDCARCFENIGRCCYDDPTIDQQVGALTATCEATPRCARCCNECAARTCAELLEAGDCPNR